MHWVLSLLYICYRWLYSWIWLNGLNSWLYVVKQMWPDLIAKAKEGGIDVIQTYVFWNGHEPERHQVISILILFEVYHVCMVCSDWAINCWRIIMLLQYNFEERFDLVRFLKTVQAAGRYDHLRIGPYAYAEWKLWVCMYISSNLEIKWVARWNYQFSEDVLLSTWVKMSYAVDSKPSG